MSDIVTCPSCQRKLRIRPELQGEQVKCPACMHTFHPSTPAGLDLELDREEPVRSDSRRDEEVDYDRLPRRRRRYEDDDDYDDDYDDRPRRRRRRRRDWADHRGTLVLALGIAAILMQFPFITGPLAWIMGSHDLREMREGRMDPEGESNTRVGMILGMVTTILMVVGVLFFCAIIGLLIVAR